MTACHSIPSLGSFLHWMLFVGVVTLPLAATGGEFETSSSLESRNLTNKIRASQFLHRATFGPTRESIDVLATRMNQIGVLDACDEWIDDQFALPASLHEPTAIAMIDDDGLGQEDDNVWIQRYRYHAWWHHALTAEDQLRQRVAWALIQILVTSEDGNGFNDRNTGRLSGIARWLGPTNYYDMLIENAFSNYRTILQDVTYHPIMGVYLSHVRNRKAEGNRFPDENYAREVMQLFSIGLYELRSDGTFETDQDGNLIATYDNELIKEFARVFTGLAFADDSNPPNFWRGNDFEYPMEMYQQHHDEGAKTLLGGEVISLGSDGDADIAAALDNLFAHDNVGPFIGRLLIQRLVMSNPSRAYIGRVSAAFNDNGQGVRGDMRAVIKAVLLDPEGFRSQRLLRRRRPNRVEVITRGTEYSRLREPVIRYAGLLRAMHPTSDYSTGRMMVPPMDWDLQQAAYKSPSVFNFYLPNFQPPGDLIAYTPSSSNPSGALYAPEFQLLTGVTANRLINRFNWDISSQKAQYTLFSNSQLTLKCNLDFDLDYEKSLATEDQDMHELLDDLDLVFCHGSLPQDYKDRVVDVINQKTQWMKNNEQWRPELENFRVESAVIAVATSPFCAIAE